MSQVVIEKVGEAGHKLQAFGIRDGHPEGGSESYDQRHEVVCVVSLGTVGKIVARDSVA